MELRKEHILQLVVEHYTRTSDPVGSKFLVEECGLDVSGATVRNDMHDLEEYGYLTHPHTSAGRIPTEDGYRYYVDTLMKEKIADKKAQQEISALLQSNDEPTARIKSIAKFVAEETSNAVIVSFGSGLLYYTGMSYMFAQPEFRDYAYLVRVTSIFDQCEERIHEVYDAFSDSPGPKTFIGNENPLGTLCGLVAGRLSEDVVFSFLGPVRMDYARAHGLITYIQNSILKHDA